MGVARIYRTLLRLAPAELRGTHGRDMERLFVELLESEPSLRKRAALWLDATRDLATSRLRNRARPHPTDSKGDLMSGFFQDLRLGARTLVRSPGFTVVALLTLAVGIGANTAIFSVVNAVVLEPLPYRDADRLVAVWEAMPTAGFFKVPFAPPDYRFLEEQQESFASLGAAIPERYELSGDRGTPQMVSAARVTAGFFGTLGVDPALGRGFREEEDAPGNHVVVISDGLWRTRYGADLAIVGKTLDLDRVPHTVIGVMPRGFKLEVAGAPQGSSPELWVPRAFSPAELQAWLNGYGNFVVARLAPGVSVEQAQANLVVLAKRLQEQYPPQLEEMLPGAKLELGLAPLHGEVVGPLRVALLMLLGAVALVLLIGCANVANLVLARATARSKEIAVRTALGASRLRILGQMIGENLVLAVAGGLLGLLLAYLLLPVLVALAPDGIPRVDQIAIDGRVLLVTLALSLFTAVFFAIGPGLSATRTNLSSALQQGARGSSGGSRRMQSLFVTAEMTLAVVLLISAGLLMRSFSELIDTDPGFRPEQVLSVNVPLPLAAYSEPHRVRNLYDTLIERVHGMPGVVSVAASSDLPLSPTEVRGFQRADRPPTEGSAPQAGPHSWVLGQYAETMGIRLLRGRLFTPQDRQDTERVIIISETMAQLYWPDEDPLGAQVTGGGSQTLTVVGIVGDVKDQGMARQSLPHTYVPYRQEVDGMLVTPVWAGLRNLNLVVRTQGEPLALASAVRAELRRLDPQLAIGDVAAMTQAIDNAVAPRRFAMLLMGVFAGSALFLSAVGLYGVIAYSVSRRTREVGIRMALGAQRRDAIALVLRQGLRLSAISVGVGLLAALGVSRLLAGVLYGISALDPVTFVGVPLVLCGVSVLACWLPARRAARVDPIHALRCE